MVDTEGLPLILSTRSGWHTATGIREYLMNHYLPQALPTYADTREELWVPTNVPVFADTSSKFRIERNIRGRDVYIVSDPYSWATLKPKFNHKNHVGHTVHLSPESYHITQDGEKIPDREWKISTDANFMELIRAVEIAKESVTSRGDVTVVMPCHAYARQDNRDGRESLDLQIAAMMLENAGADLVITLDVHNEKATKNAYRKPTKFENLKANHTIVNYTQQHPEKYPMKNAHFVALDDNGLETNVDFARKLGIYEEGSVSAVIKPDRDPTKPNVVDGKYYGFVGDQKNVEGMDVYSRDDILDTGGTVIKGAQVIKEELGAKSFTAVITHGILSHPSLKRFQEAYESGLVDRVLMTDSVTHTRKLDNYPVFDVVSIHKLLAKAIFTVNRNGSLQNLT